MKVIYLGGTTGGQGSPRLYLTERESFAVQGWKTGREDQIEIPHKLLAYTEPGTCLAGLQDTGRDTFLLLGTPLRDPEALSAMTVPDHETVVEVAINQEVTPGAPDLRR